MTVYYITCDLQFCKKRKKRKKIRSYNDSVNVVYLNRKWKTLQIMFYIFMFQYLKDADSYAQIYYFFTMNIRYVYIILIITTFLF